MEYSYIILLVFVIGYVAIAFEHAIHLNKAASALFTGVVCWVLYFFTTDDKAAANHQLIENLGDISSILFFLLGAMTIVELIDTHEGFDIIKNKITTLHISKLLFVITMITFFLSALLDNLTTAIVMCSLVSKLIKEKNIKLWFCGMIIIASNAGGAWSPLGDVTTTMLWIGGQISPIKIISSLFLASLFVCLVPLAYMMFKFRKQSLPRVDQESKTVSKEGLIILVIGVLLLVFVPVFKTLTHLPPFMGILLALSLMWVTTAIIHHEKEEEIKAKLSVANALQKIDTPSILFFLGILLSISALENVHILKQLAVSLQQNLPNDYAIGFVLGILSSVVDNVPLVAAAQNMFDMNVYTIDHTFWHFLALTTGTGGSLIIIGSAAGVAVMGMENINFIWYLQKIGWLALLGYLAGIGVYILQHSL
ncbi:MAG: sodium:proton antiporter NhaD [Bacteroidetes bacterium]|nr:sodium:proton antiporter NhaD [Bacteroidota bacterium]